MAFLYSQTNKYIYIYIYICITVRAPMQRCVREYKWHDHCRRTLRESPGSRRTAGGACRSLGTGSNVLGNYYIIIRPIRVMNITACYVIHGNNKSFRPAEDAHVGEKNKNSTTTTTTARRAIRAAAAAIHCIGRKTNYINIIIYI